MSTERRYGLPGFTIRVILIAAAAYTASACGGGGGDGGGGPSNTPPPPPAPPTIQTGVFKDSNVAGLEFASGSQSGLTDAAGRFTCETGEQVSFAIGGVDLGQAVCSTLITPNRLATDNLTFDLEVANLSRFLQMLDEDGDPTNGIVISDAVRQIAVNWPQVDFLSADLSAGLVTIISDAASVDGTLHTLPTAADALGHLVETLECAYAGAYAGTFSGSNSGAAGMVIGWGRFGFTPLAFDWYGFDSVNDFIVAGGGSGSITIRQLPEIDHTAAGLAGPIDAAFTTPDRIAGTWDGGNVTLDRIGADNGGEYRFVGKASSIDAEAFISLNLTGNAFNGEAFDVIEGTRFAVTGSLTGTAVSLSAIGGGSTNSGTGTLTTHPDGSPDEIRGTFDDGSSFAIAACRLN